MLAVLVPAQITVLVLAVGWALGSFRPVSLLLAAVRATGAGEVFALRGEPRWTGPMAPRLALGRLWQRARANPLIALVVAVASAFVAWQSLSHFGCR